MAKYQVIEKTDFGTDWAPVRYNDQALTRFDSEEAAMKEAIRYLTETNCNNVLTKTEKRHAIEAYMMNENGCFLGVLDGEDWYLTYPKDIVGHNPETGQQEVLHAKGDVIKDTKWFELEGKTQVAVRPVPGT